MLYLLDANVLIDADRDYYALNRVPEFWAWLLHQAVAGVVAIPYELYAEIVVGNGSLVDWLKENRQALLHDEEADAVLLQDVPTRGYGTNLTKVELQKIGKDPFIVAYARAAGKRTTVVTTEVSRPGRQRANRKLPDVLCHVRPAMHPHFRHGARTGLQHRLARARTAWVNDCSRAADGLGSIAPCGRVERA